MKKIVAFGVDLRVPQWARYAAKDDDGQVWIYEEKPLLTGGKWLADKGNCIKVMRQYPSILNERDLIERV